MSNRYNDIHKQQIFEQGSRAFDDGVEAINTLRDLTVSGELTLIDYMEFMTALNETLQIRLREGIKNKELELLKKGII